MGTKWHKIKNTKIISLLTIMLIFLFFCIYFIVGVKSSFTSAQFLVNGIPNHLFYYNKLHYPIFMTCTVHLYFWVTRSLTFFFVIHYWYIVIVLNSVTHVLSLFQLAWSDTTYSEFPDNVNLMIIVYFWNIGMHSNGVNH